MIVDDAARRCLERRRERCRRFRHVLVDERLELRRLIAHEERCDDDEQLGLTLIEIAHRVHHRGDVVLMLAHGRSRRMLARGSILCAAMSPVVPSLVTTSRSGRSRSL